MYQSLFEFLGTPAGPDLGKQVYAAAKRRGVKVNTRQVSTPKYRGTILTYPVDFLNNYFMREIVSNQPSPTPLPQKNNSTNFY